MPNRGPLATPETMWEIATAAELGYGWVIIVSDHIVVPRKIDPNYPYSENGEFRWTSDGEVDCMEQFTLLAWLAAANQPNSYYDIGYRNSAPQSVVYGEVDRNDGCSLGWPRDAGLWCRLDA